MPPLLNGQVTDALLRAIGTPGRLDLNAARSFDALRSFAAGHGRVLTGTTAANHAYRTVAEQVRLFEAAYTTDFARSARKDPKEFRDMTWWRKPRKAAAAVPGTSNHGLGVAVDFQGLGGFAGSGFTWMTRNARGFGWNNREGRRIDEAWHWVYDPDDDDEHGASPLVAPEQEGTFMALSFEEERRVLAWADQGQLALGQLRSLIDQMKPNTDRLPHLHQQADLTFAHVGNAVNGIKTLLGRPPADTDERAIARLLVEGLGPLLASLPDEELSTFATAVNAEVATRGGG